MSRTAKTLVIMLLLCWAALAGQAQTDETAASPYAAVPTTRTADGGFVLGDPAAEVKIIEFADFLCSHCQNYKPVIDSFIQDYVLSGQAQFEYRMFPVVDPTLSPLSAALVECADAQAPGTFFEAHDRMFEWVSSQGFVAASAAADFAALLDLDAAALSECADSATQHQQDAAYGQQLGVRGTPALFVQYGSAAPLSIALALPEQYAALVNANRPPASPPTRIETGRYAGISTHRTADGGFVLGSPDAPLTIVAFEDFMCPHCQAYQSTLHQFIETYVRSGQAQFEYRFFPVVHSEYSPLTAAVAECAGLQDPAAFWNVHDLLFEFASVGAIDTDIGSRIAALSDLDADAIADCLGGSMQALIDVQLGQQAGVGGTPGMRARAADGELQVIYAGQQPLERGGTALEVLGALAEGSPQVSIGAPQRRLRDASRMENPSLLSGEPCRPPCWQNITPGQSTLTAAQTALAALESFQIADSNPSGFELVYDGGGVCCQVASQDGALVSHIILQFAPHISVADVIAEYGEPTYVTGQEFSADEAMLTLFYPEDRMLLYALTAGSEGELTAESPLVSAIYTSETLMTSLIASTPLDIWKGYLKYSDYMDGQFDHNP